MAKVISQETFDEVVQENIVEFSAKPSEAKEETIKQFEAQGINLTNIIKNLQINEVTGKPLLNESIEILKLHSCEGEKQSQELLLKNLDILHSECNQSVPHRVLAGKLEAQKYLLAIIDEIYLIPPTKVDDLSVLKLALKCEVAITTKHPDIFNADSLVVIIKLIEKYPSDSEVICLCLQWLSKACIMHETNRQNIMNANIISYVKPFVASDTPEVVRNVCSVFRHLILDDDIRVEFGKAHEHARVIAIEVLEQLTKLLPGFDDINVLSDLLVTIASISVRHEFCLVIEKAGGLEFVLNVMSKYPNEVRLNREAMKLLRALAGHDQVKINIIKQGAAPIIQNVLSNYKENETICVVTLACISTLTLRVNANSLAFFDTNIPETIVETMKLHPKNKLIQRNGAWSIRNMVSRARDNCEKFLIHGVEEILNNAMQEHPTILQDIKAALRDLNCNVELKEEWTGKPEREILNIN